MLLFLLLLLFLFGISLLMMVLAFLFGDVKIQIYYSGFSFGNNSINDLFITYFSH